MLLSVTCLLLVSLLLLSPPLVMTLLPPLSPTVLEPSPYVRMMIIALVGFKQDALLLAFQDIARAYSTFDRVQ